VYTLTVLALEKRLWGVLRFFSQYFIYQGRWGDGMKRTAGDREGGKSLVAASIVGPRS